MKKILIPTLAVLLLVTGCRQIPKLQNGEEKVVSFTEGGISVEELYDEMKSQYALSILLDMIDTKILNEKYQETSEEKEYISLQKQNDQSYYSVLYSGTYQTYQSYLKARYNVETESEFEDLLRLSYRREQAVKDYAKSLVSESEIKDYYENGYIPDIEASHILITADYNDSATDEEKQAAEEKALKTAKEVIEKLNNGGDFAELAKEYSKDGSADNGGSVGRFGHGDMVSEFEEAAYKLKVNEYTKEPVKTRYGYHIILKTKEYEKDSLEDAKEEIISTLADNKIEADNKMNYKALVELRDDNGVSFVDSTLKEQYENYVYNYAG